MIPDEEQNTEGMSKEELLKRPGLCLAKTHPWLKWRKDAYRIYQKTANLASWLNQNDTREAIHVSAAPQQWVDCNGKMNENW